MSKKKKTSLKQTKPNIQKPAAKTAKESAVSKKDASEPKKDAGSKSAKTQIPQGKGKQPEQVESPPAKAEASGKGKTESSVKPVSAKAQTDNSKVETPAPKAEPTAPISKTQSAPKPVSKKKDESKAPVKGQKGGNKKKDKAPRQSVKAEASEEGPALLTASEPVISPSGDENASNKVVETKAGTAASTSVPAEEESLIEAPGAAETPSIQPEQGRKIAKTLIDEEVNFSPESMPAGDSSGQGVDKNISEVSIGGLKDAAGKATGTSAKAEEPPRKVPKTLMEISTDGLRDAVEASSRAIEEEIAAAIKESEASSDGLRDSVEASSLAIEDEIAAAIKDAEAANEKASSAIPKAESKAPAPKAADRKIAKTMLDFRAEEFFELANLDTGNSEDSADAHSSAPGSESQASAPAAETQQTKLPEQTRKVAKTMLEVDISNIHAIVEAANASAQGTAPENIAPTGTESKTPTSQQKSLEESNQEPPRDLSSGYDDVSMDDLNEFAQALRDNTAMSPPVSRSERLRKTMLGIRKHGLSSSPSMPGISLPTENQPESSSTERSPLRVSRSLHPLDNFSFDNLCPADDIDAASQTESKPPEHDVLADSATSGEPVDAEWREAAEQDTDGTKKTGTVELNHNPHDTPANSEFKGVTTVWPHDQEKKELPAEARQSTVKPERFVPKTMLDMDFLKESLSASVSRAEERLAESIAQKASAPPKQLLTSDDFKIASPNCPFVWNDNSDNPKERVKYCTQCSAQIYNFTGFDMTESQSLIFKRENRKNAPLYKREDGKFMTSDCPIALKKSKDKQMLIGGTALVLILLLIMVIASFMVPQSPPASTPSADSSGDTTPASRDQSVPGSRTSDTTTSSGSSEASPSSSSSSSSSTKSSPGAYHYVRGKGVVQNEPIVVPVPESEPTTPANTNSGYDEGGKFWQYTDKGNN